MKSDYTRVPFKTPTDLFRFVAQESSEITPDMLELTQCSFQLTASRISQLQALNPRLAQWISDLDSTYASLQQSGAELLAILEEDERPPQPKQESGAAMLELLGEDARPPKPELAFDIYVVYGMRILICHKHDMKFSRNYFLRFLNQLYVDRDLLSRLVGSYFISQSLRLSTEVDNDPVYFSLRDRGEQSKFITADMSLLTSIDFPALSTWRGCGLGWLFRNQFCCDYHMRCRTPWAGNPCR